jgi:Asp-tRNA(Asn)/Glu-tRNA(Gln) amidotransferase B subunit
MSKRNRLNITLPEELLKKLEVKAMAETRTVSQQIEYELKRAGLMSYHVQGTATETARILPSRMPIRPIKEYDEDEPVE